MPAKKQITKDMILNASLNILRQQGYDGVNIKNLAAELKCSTQPVYLSFAGMDDLRNELTFLAVQKFTDIMEQEKKGGKIHLYDIEYVRMAKREPKLFCFLFMRENSFAEIKKMIGPIIEASISEFMDKYDIDHEEADYLHDNLWMHAHGIASMIATDFCDWDMSKVELMLVQCKTAFTGKYEAENVH